MSLGRSFLGKRHVLPAVPFVLLEVQVEGTFVDGTKLVTIHDPIATDDGNLELALYGSFLPVPKQNVFPLPGVEAKSGKKRKAIDDESFDNTSIAPDALAIRAPGEVVPSDGPDIVLNAGRPVICVSVTNTGDRPIQGTYFPLTTFRLCDRPDYSSLFTYTYWYLLPW